MLCCTHNNKIYYPNTTTGTSVRAYRGFFRSGTVIEDGGDEEPLAPQCVRIVVDGEPMGELEIVNGEVFNTDNAVKVIENGILYILRNGIRYDAQGQMISEN